MPLQPNAPRLLTTRDLASRLQISTRTLETLLKTNDAPAPVLVGRQRRWTEEDFVLWVEKMRPHSAARAPKDLAGAKHELGATTLEGGAQMI